jgi:hypothetical protein
MSFKNQLRSYAMKIILSLLSLLFFININRANAQCGNRVQGLLIFSMSHLPEELKADDQSSINLSLGGLKIGPGLNIPINKKFSVTASSTIGLLVNFTENTTDGTWGIENTIAGIVKINKPISAILGVNHKLYFDGQDEYPNYFMPYYEDSVEHHVDYDFLNGVYLQAGLGLNLDKKSVKMLSLTADYNKKRVMINLSYQTTLFRERSSGTCPRF